MALTGNEIIIPLRQVRNDDTAQVGRKAAVLGELMAAGFAVPDGVVITTAALARTLATAGLSGMAGGAQVLTATLPAEVAAALAQIPSWLGAGPYAVRSSAIDEDRSDASFAGQYETVLDVSTPDLQAAVRRCWSSAFADHLRTYRTRAAIGDPVSHAIAVLIQPMVRAAAAGVAFSADPITGDRGTVTIGAVPGLGDRMVNGTVSADEWQVRDGVATARTTPHNAVDGETAHAVATLARRVEACLGTPQDIEWALVAGAPILLQARPITALPTQPAAAPVIAPPGFWQREASHSPKPWTPMFRSVFGECRDQALRNMFAAFGLPENMLEFREIGGWYYLRRPPLGGGRFTPPAWLIPLLVRLVPRMRRQVRSIVASLRDDTAGKITEQWYEEWQPDLGTRFAALRDVDLTSLDDAALAAHTDRTLALVQDGCAIHYLLHGALAPILAELAFTCRDLIGWSDSRTFEMLNGLSTMSTEPALQLNRVAQLAAARPEARAALTHPDGTTLDQLRAVAPKVAAALDAHLHEYGHRALRYELVDPCIAEIPQLTIRLLADQLARGYDPAAASAALKRRRTVAIAAARAALADRSSADRQRFETALARAQRAYPIREENEVSTFSAPIALLRYALLEHGRRLAALGRIAARNDVFLLTFAEACTALADPHSDNLHVLIRQRRGERAWIEQHPGPPSYGTEPPAMPALTGLPPEAQFSIDVLQWSVDRIFAADLSSHRHTPDGPTVVGVPASPGQYTGTARIVRDELEFDRLQPGDVLVCPITSPVWSVLFPTVGALVTDSGGLLSHPAIIAREYQTPAVVATGNATTVLRDGSLVTVDGTHGRVHIHPATPLPQQA
jgi:rifampicin phosphotransferase